MQKDSIYRKEDIKPTGNFDFILSDLDKRIIELENKEYSSKVARLLKLIVNDLGLLDALSAGLLNKKYIGWDKEEQKICLLYTHLLIIRLNNIAQTHLNETVMPDNFEQLKNGIRHDKKLRKIFGNLIIN